HRHRKLLSFGLGNTDRARPRKSSFRGDPVTQPERFGPELAQTRNTLGRRIEVEGGGSAAPPRVGGRVGVAKGAGEPRLIRRGAVEGRRAGTGARCRGRT